VSSRGRHVIVLLLRASGAESLAVLDQEQTGCRSPRVISDLAVSRSYVDRWTDPAADPQRR